MTLRRNMFDGRCTDALDDLCRWALCDSVGQVQPPAYVWEKIEQQVQRRMVSRPRWWALARMWEEFKRNVRRHMGGLTGQYAGYETFYQPVIFGVWEGSLPLSLVYIIEQPMPMLRGVGWAT